MRGDIRKLAWAPAALLLFFSCPLVLCRPGSLAERFSLASSASLPGRRQLIEDTGLWTNPASPYNNTGYLSATLPRQQLAPGATFNVSVGQDDSKLLHDVLLNVTAFVNMASSGPLSSPPPPNITVACTPAYGEPLLKGTPQAYWWSDEPYWESASMRNGTALVRIRVLDERHLRIEQQIAFRTSTDIGNKVSVVRGAICTITNRGPMPVSVDVHVAIDPKTQYNPDEWTETTTIREIYKSCCKGKTACASWKAFSEENINTQTEQKIWVDWCKFPGQTCHLNGTLMTMDFSDMNLECNFPFARLAAFPYLTYLTISNNPSMRGSYEDLFTAANDLLGLEGLALTGPLGLKGTLVPDYDYARNASGTGSQFCDLVSAEENGLAELVLKDLKELTGPLPACLFQDTSLGSLSIGGTGLSGPMPSTSSISSMSVSLAQGSL